MGLVDSLLEQLDQPRHFPAQFRSFSNLGLSLVCLLQQHAPSQCPIRLLKCLRFISPASLQPVMSRLSTGLFMFGLQTARAPCDWAAIVSRRRPLERDRGCGGSFSGLGAAQALSRACSNAAEQFRFSDSTLWDPAGAFGVSGSGQERSVKAVERSDSAVVVTTLTCQTDVATSSYAFSPVPARRTRNSQSDQLRCRTEKTCRQPGPHGHTPAVTSHKK